MCLEQISPFTKLNVRMIRIFDVFLAVLGLLVLAPLFILVALIIKMDSRGPILFIQERVGINGISFKLFKFRTMLLNSSMKGGLTVGARDPRITKAGFYLRKFKIDELPQLLNVLWNDMSFVGPRPEIKKYVDLYSNEQQKVLTVKPGITDYASIVYKNENEILGRALDPEDEYVKRIMPHKILLNLRYIEEKSVFLYFSILSKTIFSIMR